MLKTGALTAGKAQDRRRACSGKDCRFGAPSTSLRTSFAGMTTRKLCVGKGSGELAGRRWFLVV